MVKNDRLTYSPFDVLKASQPTAPDEQTPQVEHAEPAPAMQASPDAIAQESPIQSEIDKQIDDEQKEDKELFVRLVKLLGISQNDKGYDGKAYFQIQHCVTGSRDHDVSSNRPPHVYHNGLEYILNYLTRHKQLGYSERQEIDQIVKQVLERGWKNEIISTLRDLEKQDNGKGPWVKLPEKQRHAIVQNLVRLAKKINISPLELAKQNGISVRDQFTDPNA